MTGPPGGSRPDEPTERRPLGDLDADLAPLDPAVVDSLRRLGDRSGRDVLGELNDLFLDTADTQMVAARRALADGNLPELARIAHALKGSSSVIGGRRVAAAAAQLELAVLQPAPTVPPGTPGEAAQRALDRFVVELEALREAIRQQARSS